MFSAEKRATAYVTDDLPSLKGPQAKEWNARGQNGRRTWHQSLCTETPTVEPSLLPPVTSIATLPTHFVTARPAKMGRGNSSERAYLKFDAMMRPMGSVEERGSSPHTRTRYSLINPSKYLT